MGHMWGMCQGVGGKCGGLSHDVGELVSMHKYIHYGQYAYV